MAVAPVVQPKHEVVLLRRGPPRRNQPRHLVLVLRLQLLLPHEGHLFLVAGQTPPLPLDLSGGTGYGVGDRVVVGSNREVFPSLDTLPELLHLLPRSLVVDGPVSEAGEGVSASLPQREGQFFDVDEASLSVWVDEALLVGSGHPGALLDVEHVPVG